MIVDESLKLCIQKIYNITEPIYIDSIIASNDYYSLIEYSDSFDFKINKSEFTLKVPNSKDIIIIYYDNIMTGTHSIVRKGFFNDETIVVKQRKSESYNINCFATEIFLQVCLFCFKSHINKCSNFNLTTIPAVFKVCNINKSPAIIIKNVDLTLSSFISKYSLKELVNVLIIIVIDLYVLQITCEFMHRDLHIGNILVEILVEPKTFTYGNFSFTTNFQPYFIDFGFACLNFETTCLQLSKNKISVTNYYSSVKECNFNRTHDLKTLLSSFLIDPGLKKKKHQKILNYLQMKLSKYLEVIKNTNTKLYIYFYNQIDVIDDEFLPENIFKDLTSLL